MRGLLVALSTILSFFLVGGSCLLINNQYWSWAWLIASAVATVIGGVCAALLKPKDRPEGIPAVIIGCAILLVGAAIAVGDGGLPGVGKEPALPHNAGWTVEIRQVGNTDYFHVRLEVGDWFAEEAGTTRYYSVETLRERLADLYWRTAPPPTPEPPDIEEDFKQP